MENDIIEWFGDFATFPAFARVMFGYVAGIASYWLYCKVKHKKFFFNWRYAGIAVGICVMIGMAVQTQVAYNLAARVALETKQCQREFQQAIIAGRELSKTNDELSVRQRDLFAEKDRAETDMWLKILAPEEPIGSLDINDPTRQAYGVAVVTEYQKDSVRIDKEIRAISDKQIEIAKDRPPLPELSCGK